MLFLQIVQMVLPVLVAMAIGFFCRRSGLLNAQGHAALKTVIGNITLPVVPARRVMRCGRWWRRTGAFCRF